MIYLSHFCSGFGSFNIQHLTNSIASNFCLINVSNTWNWLPHLSMPFSCRLLVNKSNKHFSHCCSYDDKFYLDFPQKVQELQSINSLTNDFFLYCIRSWETCWWQWEALTSPELTLSLCYCMCCVSIHVLLQSVWILSRFSSYLPLPKNMSVDGLAMLKCPCLNDWIYVYIIPPLMERHPVHGVFTGCIPHLVFLV